MEKQFLVDINPNIEPKSYDLVLCKLNEEPLQELHNIENLEIKKYFINIDEISFTVPFYITDNDGQQIKNELYDLVDGSMMVKVNNMKYFILTKPEIKTNEQTGEIYKSILGFSREYELGQKIISGYEGVSRKLYDYTNSVDENGIPIGFLNYVESHTSWRVNYINANVLLKFRYLNFPKTTLLQAMAEVQKTFDCVFQYDTINKTIDVYEISQLGHDRGLYISDKNFINSLTQTINHDEIKTRLILRCKDNISIQSINITGQPYIENFDFFKNTKYMTQNLIDALNAYDSYILTKEGEYSGYLNQLEIYNNTLSAKEIELRALQAELKVIQSNLDIAIADGQPTSTLKSQETTKIGQINTKQNEINTVKNQINTIHSNINTLKSQIDKSNHFTQDQLKELDVFIREDEFSDSNYTEDNLEELLESGKRVLAKISYPTLQFDVNVEDFLNLVEAQHIWDKFVLGDLITLEHEELGFDIQVRLVGYTHNPDDNKLNLIFSNRESVDDANIYLKDLLESLTTTSSTVDYSRFKWDKGEDAQYAISRYVNSALDLTKQTLLKAEGQIPLVDDRGIWITKENPDGSIDQKQMRIVNNVLAITNDGWNTVSTAITPSGVVAETIVGKLGAFATVQANQIVVSDDGGVLSDDVLGGSILKQNIVYNGVVINTANGLQVTASNNLARSTFNASEGILVESRPNTSSAWQRNFYVDTNGKLQAKNIEIDGSGVFKGNITGATGTFSGVVNASDYRIGGVSILSNNKIKGDYIESISAGQISIGQITNEQIDVASLDLSRNTVFSSMATNVANYGDILSQHTTFIQQNATDILLQATKITGLTSDMASINLRADGIESSVSSVSQTVTNNYNTLSGQISGVASTVSSHSSSITQLSNSITSKVEKSDYTGANLVSMIEQTASSIKLSANKIDLRGITTIYSPTSSAYAQMGSAYGDFTLVDNGGNVMFQVYNNIGSITISSFGDAFLTYNASNDTAFPVGKWDFSSAVLSGFTLKFA